MLSKTQPDKVFIQVKDGDPYLTLKDNQFLKFCVNHDHNDISFKKLFCLHFKGIPVDIIFNASGNVKFQEDALIWKRYDGSVEKIDLHTPQVNVVKRDSEDQVTFNYQNDETVLFNINALVKSNPKYLDPKIINGEAMPFMFLVHITISIAFSAVALVVAVRALRFFRRKRAARKESATADGRATP